MKENWQHFEAYNQSREYGFLQKYLGIKLRYLIKCPLPEKEIQFNAIVTDDEYFAMPIATSSRGSTSYSETTVFSSSIQERSPHSWYGSYGSTLDFIHFRQLAR